MRHYCPKIFVLLVALLMSGCSKKPPLHHEEFLYSAVGTSGILGVGAFPLANGYTFRIQNELKDQGRNVALFQIGVPGANTDIIADAVGKAVERGLETEFVTVWVGANDLIDGVPLETFSLELHRLLTFLQDDMEAYVVIANLPALQTFPNFLEEPVPEVSNQFDDAVGANLVVDFDGLHPDDQGHERLANLFMNIIRPDL